MSHSSISTIDADNIVTLRKGNWSTYQKESEQRLAVLNADWTPILKEYIRPHVDEDAWTQVYRDGYIFEPSTNVTLDIVNKIAKLYIHPPKRFYFLKNAEDSSAHYTELMEPLTDSLNRVMNESLRYSIVMGGTLVWIQYDKLSEKFTFRNLTPYEFIPQAMPNDSTQLGAVEIRLTDNLNQSPSESNIHITHEYSIIDPANPIYIRKDDNNNVIEDLSGANYPWFGLDGKPYLPLVYSRLGNSTSELVDVSKGLDLFEASLRAGWLGVQEEWLTRLRTHKQMALIGSSTDIKDLPKQLMDPSSVVIIPIDPTEASLESLDTVSDPATYATQMNDIAKNQAVKYGFGNVDFTSSAAKQSFEALSLNKADRDESIMSMARDFRMTESEIALVIIKINNQLRLGNQIPEDGKFVIKYERSLDYTVVVALGMTGSELITSGIISKEGILMGIDPNISSMEEAEDQIKANTDKLPPPPELPEVKNANDILPNSGIIDENNE